MDRTLPLRRLAPFAATSLFFAMMTALWLGGAIGPYDRIIRVWGINPFFFPFLDTDTILSAVRCRQAGVDVYAWNPCDTLGRVYDYSPLWLGVAHLPGIGRWIVPIGLACDLAFLAALLWLPAGRARGDAVVIAAGTISSAAMYALERGNNDLVIFTLGVIAAELSCRSRGVRLVGYGAALLAGLLKYYPMTVLALAVREPPRRLFAIVAAVIAALAVFVALAGDDLVRALALIPTGAYVSDMFGSSTLAGGLYGVFATTDAPGRVMLQAAMTVTALALAAWYGARPALAADLATLSERERAFLMAGAMLVLGCFFTAQNIGYRAIHLILVLPALTALRRAAPGGERYARVVVATLLLLWAEEWRYAARRLASHLAPDHGVMLQYGTWLVRELLWWFVIVTLASFVIALLRHSESGVAMLRLLGHRPRRPVRVIVPA